jgi:hypothetical protein
MAKELQVEIEKDNVQHRSYFIEDYSETESVYVFKMQHCYADGLALVNYLYILQDEDNICQLPKFRFYTTFQKYFLYAISPFIAMYALVKIKTMVTDVNVIANGKQPTGVKRASFGDDIPLELIKKKSKELGVTINDVIMGVCSLSLKEYLESKGDH